VVVLRHPELDTEGPTDAVVGIRPDYVVCREKPAHGTVEAVVTSVRDLGAAHLVHLTVEGAPLVARVPAGEGVPAERCWVELQAGKVHLFRNGHLVPGGRPVEGVA
jgi:ABC-type sugar transport system ATPase subunit